MSTPAQGDHVADPLERRTPARTIVLATLAIVGCSLILSSGSATPTDLPGITLGSPALLHLERALFVGVGASVLLIFAVRGWAGYFPSKISTTGAEYLVKSATSEAVRAGDDAAAALREMEAKQVALAASLRRDMRALERRLAQRI